MTLSSRNSEVNAKYLDFDELFDSGRDRKVKRQKSEHYEHEDASFPWKLYYLMLETSADIIDWVSHGLAFRLLDVEKFCNEIVPHYFKRT